MARGRAGARGRAVGLVEIFGADARDEIRAVHAVVQQELGNAALADPNVKARYADLGTIVLGGSPADFGKLIAEDAEKWGKVIRAANFKAE